MSKSPVDSAGASASSSGAFKPKKRNPQLLRSIVKREGEKLVTTEELFIDVPKKYEKKGLLELKESVYFYGVCCFISGEDYSVGLIPALFETRPFNIVEIEIDDMIYYRFSYPKGAVVLENTEVALRDTLTYDLFDLFVAKGKIPWFIGYEDVEKIFWNMTQFAGTNLGVNPVTNEMISAYLARSAKDPEVFFRHTNKSRGDFNANDFTFVGLSNVFYSAPTVLNKIAGSYFKDGLVSALLTEPTEVSRLEKAVRD